MFRKIVLWILPLGAILFIAAVTYLAEATLHVPKKVVTQNHIERAEAIARKYQYDLLNIEVRSGDAVLRAWYFKKRENRKVVILLHGQGDNRTGMLNYVNIFLRNHFNVLTPDSRAHGLSGGTMSTYGIKEVADLSNWINWLAKEDPGIEVFGLGESMGAAILLQTVKNESRWKALVAESAFSDFRTIAVERLHKRSGLPLSVLVDTAIAYTRLRHGLNFRTVSPADAVLDTSIPILLIHGVSDNNINAEHSDRIAATNPLIELWNVPNTGHTAAYGTHPEEFEARVLSLFKGDSIQF